MAFVVIGTIVAEAVVAEVAIEVVAGSVLDAVVGEAVFSELGGALLGELGETFVGSFLGEMAGEVGVATESLAEVTAEGLGATGEAAEIGNNAAAEFAKESGIANTAAEQGGVAENASQAVSDTAQRTTAQNLQDASKANKVLQATQDNDVSTPAQAVEAPGGPDARMTGPDQLASARAGAVPDQTVTPAGPSSGGSTLDKLSQWANQNMGLITAASGVAKVVGGAGAALLGASSQDKLLEARKDQVYNDITGAQRASAEGGGWSQNLGFGVKVDANGKPITPVLQRPGSGQPVYKAPGIVTGAMNKP